MGDYTTTPNYGLYKPTVDADEDMWGTHLNANADTLDTTLKSISIVTAGGPFLPLAGNATVTGPVYVTATGSTTSRSVQARWGEVANVRDFGAVGDGVANDTAAFTAACAATYKRVRIPTGIYRIDPIIVPAGVALCGDVPGPLDPSPGFTTTPIGATLLVNSHASAFVTLNVSSALNDVIIYDPGQVAPTAAAPNVFPAQVLMSGSSRVRGVTLCNAYIGIQVGIGRCIVEDCYIGAYSIGVDVDHAADVTYFCNVWLGVFYDSCVGLFPFQAMDVWVMSNNGIGFRFGRADAVSLINCGCYIKWAGIYLQDGSPAGASYGWCANFNIDNVVYGMIANSSNAVGWTFANMTVLPNQDARWPAVAPFYLAPGGSYAPVISWLGGSNGVTPYWSSPNGIVSAGGMTVRGVNNITDNNAATTLPLMNGAATIGTGSTWARAGHIHPSDTSRLATAGGTMSGALTMANAQAIHLMDVQGSTAPGWVLQGDNTLALYSSDASGNALAVITIGAHNSSPTMGISPACEFIGRVGFNATAPIARPTVTGAKGSNAALASLMTALAAYGLVTDSTSA